MNSKAHERERRRGAGKPFIIAANQTKYATPIVVPSLDTTNEKAVGRF